jgi:hypothetical protein
VLEDGLRIVLYIALGVCLSPLVLAIIHFIGRMLRKWGFVEEHTIEDVHPGFKFDVRLSKEMNYYRAEAYFEEHAPHLIIDRDHFDQTFDCYWKLAIAEHAQGTFSDIDPKDFRRRNEEEA